MPGRANLAIYSSAQCEGFGKTCPNPAVNSFPEMRLRCSRPLSPPILGDFEEFGSPKIRGWGA